jgi:hypothetical protein
MRRNNMRKTLLVLALVLIPTLASSQVRFEQDVNCTPATGAMTAEVGRGCLLVEASIAAFADLRDALTMNMPDAGGGNVTMGCTQCSVDKGVSGCATTEDSVVIAQRDAAVHRIACILTSLSDQKRLADDVQAAQDGFVPGGDIGNGDPG